jgi:hypothetical protein
LDANGSAITISGGNAVRLFQVASNVNFRVKGLTLADGSIVGTNGQNALRPYTATPGQDVNGACILNLGGNLVLNNCAVTNHYLRGGNGGIDAIFNGARPGKGGDAVGAAICSLGGQVDLTNCLFVGNAALGGSGGGGSPSLQAAGGQAIGGAIYCENASSTLEQLTFASNTVTGGYPGLYVLSGQKTGAVGGGGRAAGGAFYATNSALLLEKSALVQNSLVSQGPGGDAMGGALFVSAGSSATVRLCSFGTNSAVGGVIEGATFGPSGAGRGGAVFNEGDLQVWASTFSGNFSVGESFLGASGPGAGQGGAIYSIGLLSVNASTFFSNSTIGGSAVIGGTYPAGAGEGGAIWSSTSLSMTNSTFTANRASGGSSAGNTPGGGPANGGGVCIIGGTASLVNVTITANRVDGTNNLGPLPPLRGGDLFSTNATVLVQGSIFANGINGGDVWGVVTDRGYNICSDGTANFSATGSRNQADPMLAALSDNGGPTLTMALLVGSPARDAIISGFPPVDQRGVTRPQGTAADIGAFEADFVGNGTVPPLLVPTRLGQYLTITLNAQSGRTYRLLSSTNLYTWRSISTNSAISAGPLQFFQRIVVESNNSYRVVTP